MNDPFTFLASCSFIWVGWVELDQKYRQGESLLKSRSIQESEAEYMLGMVLGIYGSLLLLRSHFCVGESAGCYARS